MLQEDGENESGASSSDGENSDNEEEDSAEEAKNIQGGEGQETERQLGSFAEEDQVLRLQSADYSSQPSNKIKKIVAEITQKIFTTISK